MAKVTITMTIDVPGYDDYKNDPDAPAYLQQNLFDDVVNYNTCAHLQDALKWCVEAQGDGSMATNANLIMEHHNLWADIMKKSEWSFTVEDDDA